MKLTEKEKTQSLKSFGIGIQLINKEKNNIEYFDKYDYDYDYDDYDVDNDFGGIHCADDM